MRKEGSALRQAQGSGSSTRLRLSEPATLPLSDVIPNPPKYRHDGWTPERQKAFIEALADCGSVTRAAAMVNMVRANCYTLRRAPGAEEFRQAWNEALDPRVERHKDLAAAPHAFTSF